MVIPAIGGSVAGCGERGKKKRLWDGADVGAKEDGG